MNRVADARMMMQAMMIMLENFIDDITGDAGD